MDAANRQRRVLSSKSLVSILCPVSIWSQPKLKALLQHHLACQHLQQTQQNQISRYTSVPTGNRFNIVDEQESPLEPETKAV